MIKTALEFNISIKEYPFVQDFIKSIDTQFKDKGECWKAFVNNVIEGGLRVLFIERFEIIDSHELVFDIYIGFVNGDLDLSCAGRVCAKDMETLQKRYELNSDFIFKNNWELSKEDAIKSFLEDLTEIEFIG